MWDISLVTEYDGCWSKICHDFYGQGFFVSRRQRLEGFDRRVGQAQEEHFMELSQLQRAPYRRRTGRVQVIVLWRLAASGLHGVECASGHISQIS